MQVMGRRLFTPSAYIAIVSLTCFSVICCVLKKVKKTKDNVCTFSRQLTYLELLNSFSLFTFHLSVNFKLKIYLKFFVPFKLFYFQRKKKNFTHLFILD